MTHYICTSECKGVSHEAGTCQAASCPKHGQPLVECDCSDELHADVRGASAGEAKEDVS